MCLAGLRTMSQPENGKTDHGRTHRLERGSLDFRDCPRHPINIRTRSLIGIAPNFMVFEVSDPVPRFFEKGFLIKSQWTTRGTHY